MKNVIRLILLITVLPIFSQKNSAEEKFYYVTAKNGLNVRVSPDVSSRKIAKIPFGMYVEKIADTDIKLIIKDNEKKIAGQWVRIKYYNYPYLINNNSEQNQYTGYVFDGFLKRIYTNQVSATEIAQSNYMQLLKKAYKPSHKSRKIKDLDSIKALLKHRLEWVTEFEDSLYIRDDALKSIITANGQKLMLNQTSNDLGFSNGWSGYYPEYEILVLEGGHSSDVTFSIKTGATTTIAGNPDYIIESPQKKYRLNGYFGGQECVSYFFQKKEGENYVYVTDFNWKDDVCKFHEFYWISNYNFIYKIKSYEEDDANGIFKYYKGTLKNNTN